MTTDRTLVEQYRDSRNLEARIRLHRLFSTNPYGWYRWYLDLLSFPANARVLELGCGPAALWQGSTDRLPEDARLVLTDLSPGMVRQAQNSLPGGRFQFAVAAAQAVPFPPKSFDLVLANHMLYHVPDRDRAIAEIRRVLKPGGSLYAATNGCRHMAEMDEFVVRAAGRIGRIGRCASLTGAAAGFTLENGQEQLSRHFDSLRLERYPDSLVVTEAQPFVDYVLSMVSLASQEVTQDEIDQFTRLVQAEIQERGPIRITKDAGVWIAS